MKVTLEFEPFWIGLRWDHVSYLGYLSTFDLWLCVVPCVVVHFNLDLRRKQTASRS